MGEVKVTTRTRRAPGAKREAKASEESARIAVVGIPASGKTTYFRFLSGHFGLNLPITYVPPPANGWSLPLFGDLESDVALEETTYETADPTDPEGSLETTTRYYVNRPLEDRKKLWVELSAGRENQGILRARTHRGPRERLELDGVDRLLVLRLEPEQLAVREVRRPHRLAGGLDDPMDGLLDREATGRDAVALGDPDHLAADPTEVVMGEDQGAVEVEGDAQQGLEEFRLRREARHRRLRPGEPGPLAR